MTATATAPTRPSWRDAAASFGRAIRRVGRNVAPLGWMAVVLGIACMVIAHLSGWVEFATIAAGLAIGLAVGLACTVGRQELDVAVRFEPARVVAGETAVGSVSATNAGRRRLLPFRLAAPIGTGRYSGSVPSLAPGGTFDDGFILPTQRRARLTIGPFTSVRGDPIGFVARTASWTKPEDFYVHPVTSNLNSLTAGWLNDLEGVSTNDLSMNDVAFHTLRQYVPGDDRRHVHWKSSAKTGTLMVRQFVDTRRSHLGTLLSNDPSEYANPDDYELGVSVVGSLGRRALLDGQEVTSIVGEQALGAATATQLLDSLSGVELVEGSGLSAAVSRAADALSKVSVVVLVTGHGVDLATLRMNAERLPRGLRVVGIRVRRGAGSALRRSGTVTVIELGDLESLDALVRAASA
jgi:uncharacterized protein (DUF58 family)